MKAASAGVARRHGMRVGRDHGARTVTMVVVVVVAPETGVAPH
jgi:hypothetical protein